MNVFVLGHFKNPSVEVIVFLHYTLSLAIPVLIITLDRELPSLANCSHFLFPPYLLTNIENMTSLLFLTNPSLPIYAFLDEEFMTQEFIACDITGHCNTEA